MTGHDLYVNHVKPAANFVAAHGPAFGVERWEEQDGYSPSTIAAEIAGLVAAADLADANGDRRLGLDLARYRRRLPALDQGLDGDDERPRSARRYFIRLSKTGDPNAAISYNVGNGGPTLDQRQVIDQGFLELTRLGELPANDPDVLASLPVVDSTIRATTRPAGVPPLQRRRLRGPLQRRPPVGAERRRHRPPLARAFRPSGPNSAPDRRHCRARERCSTRWAGWRAASA